jgi:hypothetical protein
MAGAIAARRARIRRGAPLTAEPARDLAADEAALPRAVIPERDGTEPLRRRFSDCAVAGVAAGGHDASRPAAEALPVVAPGRSGPRRSPGTPARPARVQGHPLPGSTGRRRGAGQLPQSASPDVSAELAGQARERDQVRDICGGYSGYSEDTAIDNVSSPKPRACGGYGEDTQNGA